MRTTEKIIRWKFNKFQLLFVQEVVCSFLLKSFFFRKITSAPHDPKMTLNASRPKLPHIMFSYYPRVPNFTHFGSTICSFPCSRFLVSPSGTLVWKKFEKKDLLKIRISTRNYKNQCSFLFFGEENSGQFWKRLAVICRRSKCQSHWPRKEKKIAKGWIFKNP